MAWQVRHKVSSPILLAKIRRERPELGRNVRLELGRKKEKLNMADARLCLKIENQGPCNR